MEKEDGANFSLFSENAEKVELLLYPPFNQKYPKEVIELREKPGINTTWENPNIEYEKKVLAFIDDAFF